MWVPLFSAEGPRAGNCPTFHVLSTSLNFQAPKQSTLNSEYSNPYTTWRFVELTISRVTTSVTVVGFVGSASSIGSI